MFGKIQVAIEVMYHEFYQPTK